MLPCTLPPCLGHRAPRAAGAAVPPPAPLGLARPRLLGVSPMACRAHPEGQSSAIGQDLLRSSSMLQEADGELEQQVLPPPQTAPHSTGQGAPALSSVSGSSWQQWMSYFESCDTAAERMAELGISLKDAVRQEDYRLAASLKAELTQLEQQDAVAVVQQQLKAALAEERYGDAAVLSQGALTGLQGWWAGQAEGDPVGHLLHVKQDYSRWTGRVFRPRDVADMKVNKSSGLSRSLLPRPAPVPTSKPTGSPVFEVFVRNKAGMAVGAPQLLQQAVSLQLAPYDEPLVPTRDFGSRPSAGPSSLQQQQQQQQGSVVRLSVAVRQDGTARIRPLPLKTSSSSNTSGSGASWSRSPVSSSASGTSSSSTSSAGAAYGASHPESSLASLGSDEVVDIASQNAMSSLEEGEDSPVTIISGPRYNNSNADADSRSVPSSLPWSSLGNRYQPSRPMGLDEATNDMVRLPARVELVGRDQLVYHVPDSHPATARRARWASSSTAPRSAPQEGSAARDADPLGFEEEGSSYFEVIVPMASASPSAGVAAAREHGIQLETLRDLADQVAQSMEAKVGYSSTRDDIVEAMQDVLRRVAGGEPMASIDVFLSGGSRASSSPAAAWRLPHPPSPVAAGTATATAPPDVPTTTITYKRINTNYARTDPLSGLYLGSFGPHGPELLHLARSFTEGEEVVSATKLTGDANVPAGLVSFRAKVGRKHRLDGRDIYPDELGITARYKGEGRVAQKGFSQPKWVEGELLVFNAKGNPLTAGAELGFVWAVPGEKRFLILLNRVELS